MLGELRERPDERRCRTAARLLLTPPDPTQGRVVSVYERPPVLGEHELTADERAELLRLPLPGRLVLAPALMKRMKRMKFAQLAADGPLTRCSQRATLA